MRERDSENERGVSTLTNMLTPSRAPGIPSKRATSADRGAAVNGKQSGNVVGNGKAAVNGNGKHNRDPFVQHATREAFQFNYRGKTSFFRTLKGEAIDGGFFKSAHGLYKIGIFVIFLCFLAITIMQGSVMFIVKHTDFLTIQRAEVSTSSDIHWFLPEAKGISECEIGLRSAVENFTEHLSLKSSVSELPKLERDSRRPPRLALICPNLEDVLDSVHLSTIARGLRWLGYGMELYALQDGPFRFAWEDIGVPIHILQDDMQNASVDWSNFEGVLAVSLDGKKVVDSLSKEPFTDIPVIWMIGENIVLEKDIAWNASDELLAVYTSWLKTFNRSTVVVFPNYFLPMAYNDFYIGNFFVIPGSPWDVWEPEQYMLTHTREDVRAKAGLDVDDYAIVVVGSPCNSKKIWREHAIIMKAVATLISSYTKKQGAATLGRLRLLFYGHGNSTSSYEHTLQMIAQQFGLGDGVVNHVGVDRDIHEVLWLADTVVYGSLWEELSFPPILIRAMTLKRPLIVPNLDAISQQVVDGKSGFLFPAGDDQALGRVLLMVKSNLVLARNVALAGASLARTMLARDAVVYYSYLLEGVLEFPGEAQLPRSTVALQRSLQEVIPQGWRWDFGEELETITAADNATVKDLLYLESATDLRFVGNASVLDSGREDLETAGNDFDLLNETDVFPDIQGREMETMELVEDEMIKDRLEKDATSFEEVKKMVKKTETRVAQDRHPEIDNLEVERVAQPLCIYEPYYGSGAWSFLHRDHLLYRGLSLSPHERRPLLDDVDGGSRLGLLNDSYYRDVLCDVAGFFSIAKLIDRLHRNAWIGFQPWRAVSKQVALTLPAEAALLAAVSTQQHGDAVYFWAQMESKDSQPADDFWNACDLANAGNCRSIFYDTFKQTYGLPSHWKELPLMPTDTGTWAAMHCWAMPTTSFLEYIMFARMFVSALDAQQYENHHDRGRCCFKVSRIEVKHCYCNFLEGLVNIWAYHSARRMIYLDPETGMMLEQHNVGDRMGQMRAKWFNQSLLKSMDEDLAEEADEGPADRRWLWPETGEVYWAGTKEKERKERFEAKVEKKRKQLERLAARVKYKQKSLGARYRKPKVAKEKMS
ncbi:unnamed protein product [Calypogeia fissa]